MLSEMGEVTQHRKLIRHYDLPGHAHELTFSCYLRKPLLDNDGRRRLFSQSLDAAIHTHHFHLIAFVYMPEHVHLLVVPQCEQSHIDQLLYAIKRPFSYRVKQQLRAANDPLLTQLTIRERPGKYSFRFWQEGGGYDRNITSVEAIRIAAEYIHNNPVRRGLSDSPEQWKWSSWRAHHKFDAAHDPDLPIVSFPPLK
jgi:putative transposase